MVSFVSAAQTPRGELHNDVWSSDFKVCANTANKLQDGPDFIATLKRLAKWDNKILYYSSRPQREAVDVIKPFPASLCCSHYKKLIVVSSVLLEIPFWCSASASFSLSLLIPHVFFFFFSCSLCNGRLTQPGCNGQLFSDRSYSSSPAARYLRLFHESFLCAFDSVSQWLQWGRAHLIPCRYEALYR